MNNTNPGPLKRVLFVDDSPFLESIRTNVPTWSSGKWDFAFATDPVQAFLLLDTHPVDLIVIDLCASRRITGVDSLQFLHLVHQVHPHLQKAILSSSLEEERRALYQQAGAKLQLLKPQRAEDFSFVFNSLHQLLAPAAEMTPAVAPETTRAPLPETVPLPIPVPAQAVAPDLTHAVTPEAPSAPLQETASKPIPAAPRAVAPEKVAAQETPRHTAPETARGHPPTPEGFRGVLHSISLFDLLQLECRNLRSSVLEVTAGRQFGQVFIKSGAIIHATAGSKTGVDAFVRLMRMSGGGFNLEPFSEPGAHSITMSCDQLLLEASHVLDEGREETPELNSKTSWFRNAPGQSAAGPQSKTPGKEPARPARTAPPARPVAEIATPPANSFSSTSVNPPAFPAKPISLAAAQKLIGDLIASHLLLNQKLLAIAALKKDLNGSHSKLIATVKRLLEPLATIQTRFFPNLSSAQITSFHAGNLGMSNMSSELPSNYEPQNAAQLKTFLSALGALGTLDEIKHDTSSALSQLDNFLAAFKEESANFNKTSEKLHAEMARLQGQPAHQSQVNVCVHNPPGGRLQPQ
jgi:CheY-like chemotaxis protein